MLKDYSCIVVLVSLFWCVHPTTSTAEITKSSTVKDSKITDGYRIVTPPFSRKEEVESILEKVRAEIPRAEVTEKAENKLYYRLVAGSFNNMASAIRLRSNLSKLKKSPFIMKHKNMYHVIVSSHLSEKYAITEQKQLAAKRINTSIVRHYQTTPNWQINSVDSYELRDAVYAASLMSMKDVVTTIEH